MTKKKRYLVTASLLNSWGYIWNCTYDIKEAQTDKVCLEDKIADKQKEAYESFLKVLQREPTETNEYMKAGIEFEEECYKGNTCISPIIKGGAYQVVAMKNISVDGIDFLMYGRLDVLKGGVIYDIKRCFKYSLGKYQRSYQHGFYMDLIDGAKYFEYLAFDGYKLHREYYDRNSYEPTEKIIHNFMNWLKENNLLKVYFEKWEAM